MEASLCSGTFVHSRRRDFDEIFLLSIGIVVWRIPSQGSIAARMTADWQKLSSNVFKKMLGGEISVFQDSDMVS